MRRARVALSCAVLAIAGASCAYAHDAPSEAPLLANGSFEAEVSGRPAAWHAKAPIAWNPGTGRRGSRSIEVTGDTNARVLESAEIRVEVGTDYRLEGWVRAPAAEARLGVDLAGDGKALQAAETPLVKDADAWRYVAVEFTASAPRAKVWLSARGRAAVDDVAVVPVATSYLGNGDVQPDAKGRIGFWGEEKDDSIARGTRGGAHRSDPETKRRHLPTLLLESSAEWYALASVNYNVPGFTDKLKFSTWTRAQGAAAAQLLACWTDDAQQVLRIDASEEARGDAWRPLTLAPEAPPDGAYAVRLVALVRGGRAWFDDFDQRHQRPSRRIVRVFANQVGYESAGPKSAVVATNFFPADRATLRAGVIGADGQPALQIDVPCQGRIHSGRADDWGWYFWRVDFSELDRAGTFRVTATLGDARGESFPFVVGPGAVLDRTAADAVDFFYVQRCGCEVPGWHRACHLDDARLPDGTHVNATGGWHSAGDYNKPMWQFGDSGACYALAAAAASRPNLPGFAERRGSGQPAALAEARWGADFLSRMQVPTDGSMRGDVLQGPGRSWMAWKAPDDHTDNQVGTPDDPVIAASPGNTPLAIAAWAILARAPGAAKQPNDYRASAERLWNALTASDSAAANPLLLIGALELDRTTGDEKYRRFARQAITAILALQKPSGAFSGDTGDHGDVAAAAVALFALEFRDDPQRPAAIGALRKYLDFCIARSDNPFGLSRQGVEEPEASFFHPTVGLGVNFWILSRAWAALLIHRLTADPRALVYATDQIDWLLGKNPLNLCMFEGHGGFNPPRYHHRYNMIPGRERGAVPGAIANGMVRDMGLADRPGFDLSRAGGRAPSFRTSEPWLVHNMFYLLAVTALDESVNGQRASP
jgi:hypothetical protein